MRMLLSLSCAILFFVGTHGFYVPGTLPLTFQENDDVPLKVNSLTSTHTQVPRGYYRLPFCKPPDGPKASSESLGEFLTGNKIQSSAYQLNMRKDVNCQKLCLQTISKEEASKLRVHIKYQYHHNWIIDNLPSALIDAEGNRIYAGGFPIGFMDQEEKAYIHNHVNIHVDFHPRDEGYRVVGFAVEPLSVKHEFAEAGYKWDGISSDGLTKTLKTCPTDKPLSVSDIMQNQEVKSGESIIFTYSVVWKESEIAWASRWDLYLSENHLIPHQVHWYSITNSILVVLFLSLLVISVLVRSLKRDIDAYNALATLADDDEADEDVDESGWKLVHADVFRPPQTHPMLYCVFLGSGSQLAVTTFIAIVLSAVGFLSPARRGSLINTFLAFYVMSGALAGFVSSRMYKSFRGRQWQLCTAATALLFPGIAFTIFLFFNLILWGKQSAASAPLLEVLILAAIWCCVSVPLVFVGAFFGYKMDTIEYPTVTSTIARAIPPPAPLLDPRLGMAFTGVIPFAAAYVELFFIMTSLWMDHFYYVFGFTLIVYLILIVTCAEATVLLVYYQLCAENHRWWWFAFFASGSTGLYTFVYSIFWFRTLEASGMLITYLLYFGYMFLICFGMLLLFGTVGALTSLWFTRLIFSTIKVD